MDVRLGDILEMKKPHPCGSKEWEILRVGMDIKLRCDFSWRNQMSLCRDIQDVSTQATQGNRAIRLSVSADYTLSSMVTLRLYYDYQRNMPLVSSASYPVTNSDFGVSVRLSLTR